MYNECMTLRLSDHITEYLFDGPRYKQDVINVIKTRHAVTMQAVYKAIRALLAEDIVFESHERLHLSLVYLEQRSQRLAGAVKTYYEIRKYEEIATLKDGEQQTFRFSTLRALESAWTNNDLIIASTLGREKPVRVLSVMPHDWFRLLKVESNDVWTRVTQAKNNHFVLLTYPEVLDRKEAKLRSRETPHIQIMIGENPLRLSRTKYLNLIEDFLTEITIDERLVPLLARLMRGEKVSVDSILSTKGKFKMKVSRNKSRTNAIYKKTAKYFKY